MGMALLDFFEGDLAVQFFIAGNIDLSQATPGMGRSMRKRWPGDLDAPAEPSARMPEGSSPLGRRVARVSWSGRHEHSRWRLRALSAAGSTLPTPSRILLLACPVPRPVSAFIGR